MRFVKKSVIQFSKGGVYIRKYESISETARRLSLTHNEISLCCSGKKKSAGDFIFRLADDPCDLQKTNLGRE